MLFEPKEINKVHGGVQKLYRFENGRGASVIRHKGSYGFEKGLWELAVLDGGDDIDYHTPITSDVVGHQTEEQIQTLLTEISKL
jgi:hypothetical protein